MRHVSYTDENIDMDLNCEERASDSLLVELKLKNFHKIAKNDF